MSFSLYLNTESNQPDKWIFKNISRLGKYVRFIPYTDSEFPILETGNSQLQKKQYFGV